MTMHRINTITVQRLSQDFARIASVAHAFSASEANRGYYEIYRKDMDDAFSDLADAMGYDIAPRERAPAAARSALSLAGVK